MEVDGKWAAIHNWHGAIPNLDEFKRLGYQQPPTDNMRAAYEDCSRYDGTGQWYVAITPRGFAVVLLGHPDGKRRYIVGDDCMYHEEPPREVKHE